MDMPFVHDRGGAWGTGRFPTLSRRKGHAGGTWFPPRTRAGGERASFGDSADLVRGRDAGSDLLVEADDALDQRLGPRRAARHVDVDREDLVDALEDRVVV